MSATPLLDRMRERRTNIGVDHGPRGPRGPEPPPRELPDWVKRAMAHDLPPKIRG